MAQLLIRNIDNLAKERLRIMAISHGRSLEGEARLILEMVTKAPSSIPEGSLGDWIAARFTDIGFTKEEAKMIENLRSTEPPRYAVFDEE